MAQFNSIESVSHIEEASAIAELQCFLTGEFRIPELPFERENLSESFISHVRDNGSDWDSPEYYSKEPETCFQEARSYVEVEVAQFLEEYAELLGPHYPFTLSGSNSQVMTLKEEISPVGTAYIWLRLYMLSVSKHNYIQFEATSKVAGNNELEVFNRDFANVFEYLSAFAVSGRYGNVMWMTAKSRSGSDYRDILERVCMRIEQGRPKLYDDFTQNQKTTNDGRTDMITVTMPNGVLRADSEIYLTQATIQKSRLKDKVVTQTSIDFFNAFFAQQITFAKKGVLVVPHTFNELNQSECGSANCVYMPLGRILEYLGKVAINDNLTEISEDFVERYSNIEQKITLQRFSLM